MTVSVWYGPVGGPPVGAAHEHVPHYAASTMKVAVLAALYACGLDLATPVEVTTRFASALPGAPPYSVAAEPDLDAVSTLGRLAELMTVRSSNLATNLILARIGIGAADAVWRTVGARHSRIRRGIDDAAARDAGITNEVTAYDLAVLFGALATGTLPGSGAMLGLLERVEHRDDIAAGLPAGTRLAHKSGWVSGIRHGAGIVYPRTRPPYLLAVCTTGYADAEARRVAAEVAARSWAALGDRARSPAPSGDQ